MIVLDASSVVEWFLGLPRSHLVEQRLADPAVTLHAPHLLSIEVAQVIRRYESRNQLDPARADAAIADLADLDVIHHDHEPLLPLIWQLRANLTAYDAAYVALSLALEAPLVTLDRRLAEAPQGAQIDLIA